MKRFRRATWLLLAGLAVSGWSLDAAAAGGVAVAPTALSAKVRIDLQTAIARARLASPQAFKHVADVRAIAVRVDAHKRGRLVTVTPYLKSLGGDALLPMLGMLAFDAPERGDMTDTAWLALRVGLIEAVGMQRDPRAEPVLNAILDAPTSEYFVDRAAAEALGRLGSDRVVAKLVALSSAPGPKRLAVLDGMGTCRRVAVARALSGLIQTRLDPAVALVVVRTLGHVGNAWAWSTPSVAASGEGDATRATAAQALVGAFAAYDGDVREAAAKSILVVNDPSTPSLIREARAHASTPALAEAFDQLDHRFASNPIR